MAQHAAARLDRQWFSLLQPGSSRGPENGINTPSDLESEIRKQSADEPAGGNNPNRRAITLPILNSKGQHLLVIYDYDGKSTSKCELVTLTYPVE